VRTVLALLTYALDSTPFLAGLHYGAVAYYLLYVSWLPLLAGLLVHVARTEPQGVRTL
jgi:hypothetical protein